MMICHARKNRPDASCGRAEFGQRKGPAHRTLRPPGPQGFCFIAAQGHSFGYIEEMPYCRPDLLGVPESAMMCAHSQCRPGAT